MMSHFLAVGQALFQTQSLLLPPGSFFSKPFFASGRHSLDSTPFFAVRGCHLCCFGFRFPVGTRHGEGSLVACGRHQTYRKEHLSNPPGNVSRAKWVTPHNAIKTDPEVGSFFEATCIVDTLILMPNRCRELGTLRFAE